MCDSLPVGKNAALEEGSQFPFHEPGHQQVLNRAVAISGKHKAIAENSVGMLNHNGMGLLHASLQVGIGPIPKTGGG